MGLETNVNSIQDLNQNWPPVSDPRAQGAGHLRNLKKAIQLTFPNLKQCLLNDAQFTALGTLVGDGSGTFTVKGTLLVSSVTDWETQQAVPAKDADGRYMKPGDADGRYVGKAQGTNDYAPLQAGVSISTGNIWLSYKASDGTVKYAFAQQAGDYATNTALNATNTALSAETTRAENVESGKANLSGGNTFSGGQQVINADNQPNPLLIETSNGQGFEFGIDQDTSFIDFHSVTAGNGADFDSRIIATGDITKGTSRLDFETNTLTWGGSPLALQSQLPFPDTGLKIQVFQVAGTGNTRVSFPTAFRGGTTPYVFLQINAEPNRQVSRFSVLINSGSGNTPDVNNRNFYFGPVFTTDHSDQSGQPFTLNVLAVGYF